MAIHRDDEAPPPSHPYNKNCRQNRHPQSQSNYSSLPRHSSSNQSSPLLCQHNKKSIPVPSPRRSISSSVTSSPVLYRGSDYTRNTNERMAVHSKHSNFIVDPYQILEMPRDATRERIVESYHRLALLNHPYRFQHGHNYHAQLSVEERTKQTQEEQIREWKFIALAASYETLSVEAHRRQYDILSTHQVSRKSRRRRRKRAVTGAITPQRMFLDTSPNKREGKDYIKKSPINPTETICNKYTNAGPKPSLIGVFSESIPSENKNGSPNIPLDHEHVGLCTPRRLSGDGGSIAASSACNSVSSKNIFQCKLHFEDSDDDIDYASDNDALEDYGINIGSYDNSDDDEDDEHSQSTAETNQLFGGPLSLLYRARNHEPFMDPFQLFRLEFGSDIFRSCMDDDEEDLDDWVHSKNHGTNAENDLTMKRVQQKLKRLEMQRNKQNDNRNRSNNSTYSRPTDRHEQHEKLQQSVDCKGKDGHNNTSLGKYHSIKEQKLQSSRKRRLATGYPTLPPLSPNLLNNNRGSVIFPGTATASSPYTSDTEDGTTSVVSVSSTSLKNNPTTTTSEEMKDGVFIKRIVRNVNGNRMVRTETTTTDPVTGRKRTTIAVSKEVIDNDDFDRVNYGHPGVGSTRDTIPALINNQYTDDSSPDGVGWACCNTQSDCFETKEKSSSPSFRSPFLYPPPPPPPSAPVPSDFNNDVTPRHSNIATSSNLHEFSGPTLQKKSQEKKNLMWSHFGLSSDKSSSRDEKESIGLARLIFGCGGSFVPS